MAPASRRNVWLKRFVLVCLTTTLAVGAGELLVRVLRKAPNVKSISLDSAECIYQRSSNPLLSYELKPDYRNDHPDFNESYERTNAHGQRDRERSLKKPAGVRRVIMLGDSVVEGHGIPEADTIGRQWENLATDKSTEVLNFGVSGYCTRAEVELLQVKGLAFRPDAVVLVFVENDFHNFNREAFALSSVRPALANSLFQHSHLFRLAAVRFNLWHFGSDANPGQWSQRAVGVNNVVDGFERLSQLSRQHGFTPLIAIWPGFTDGAVIDLHYMPGDNEHLIVERLAKMYGLPTVRLSADFVRDAAKRPAGEKPRLTYTVGDGMHPSAAGCQVAARVLNEHLANLEKRSAPALTDATAGPRDEEAVAAAQSLGGERPTQCRVYNNLGAGLLGAGKHDAAIEYFQLAVKEDGNYADARSNWGQALHNLGRYQEAAVHYEAALQLNPGSADAHSNLGNTLRSLGRFDEAVAHYREALRIKPNHAEAHFNWGTALQDQREFEQAISHYQEALRIKPTYAEVHNNWGLALRDQGKASEAMPHFETALKLKPNYASAHYNCGLALADSRQFKEAIAHYQEALRLKPNYPEAHNNWGYALAVQGNFSEAVQHFQEALRLRPHFPLAQENLEKAQAQVPGK